MAAGGVRLVFDEHFSQAQVAFVGGQSALGYIVHTRKHGWSGQLDKDWMPHAIGMNLVIVSADRNERTRGFTVEDLKAMRAKVILVGGWWNHLNVWQKAKWLVNAIEKLAQLAEGMQPGTVYLLHNRHCHYRVL